MWRVGNSPTALIFSGNTWTPKTEKVNTVLYVLYCADSIYPCRLYPLSVTVHLINCNRFKNLVTFWDDHHSHWPLASPQPIINLFRGWFVDIFLMTTQRLFSLLAISFLTMCRFDSTRGNRMPADLLEWNHGAPGPEDQEGLAGRTSWKFKVRMSICLWIVNT